MGESGVANLAKKVVEYLENTGFSLIKIDINGYPLKEQNGKSEISYKALCNLFSYPIYEGKEVTQVKDLRSSIKRRGERVVELIGELSSNSEEICSEPQISGRMEGDVYKIDISKKEAPTPEELGIGFLRFS